MLTDVKKDQRHSAGLKPCVLHLINMLCGHSIMTKSEAINKIRSSIAEGVQLITPEGKSYEEHLTEVSQVLLAHVIEPIPVVLTSACFPEHDYEKYRKSNVLAIAKMGNNWLLTLESENEFALGFGEKPDNIMMHGFSSPDAVGEWCV